MQKLFVSFWTSKPDDYSVSVHFLNFKIIPPNYKICDYEHAEGDRNQRVNFVFYPAGVEISGFSCKFAVGKGSTVPRHFGKNKKRYAYLCDLKT